MILWMGGPEIQIISLCLFVMCIIYVRCYTIFHRPRHLLSLYRLFPPDTLFSPPNDKIYCTSVTRSISSIVNSFLNFLLFLHPHTYGLTSHKVRLPCLSPFRDVDVGRAVQVPVVSSDTWLVLPFPSFSISTSSLLECTVTVPTLPEVVSRPVPHHSFVFTHIPLLKLVMCRFPVSILLKSTLFLDFLRIPKIFTKMTLGASLYVKYPTETSVCFLCV